MRTRRRWIPDVSNDKQSRSSEDGGKFGAGVPRASVDEGRSLRSRCVDASGGVQETRASLHPRRSSTTRARGDQDPTETRLIRAWLKVTSKLDWTGPVLTSIHRRTTQRAYTRAHTHQHTR